MAHLAPFASQAADLTKTIIRGDLKMTAVWGASRLLFSRKEVGILLNLSPRQITRQIHNGKLRIVRIGRRTLIHRDEVERFAKNGLPFMNPQ
jgi:excisionase family DNA binding protein